jgi:DNA-binding XRE family transcriptional regulator
VNARLAALANAVNKSSQLRLLLIAREISDGGKVEYSKLIETIENSDIESHTRTYYNRLIKDDIFFRSLADGVLYLRGMVDVSRRLSAYAREHKPESVSTDRPGGEKDMYIPIGRTSREFKAHTWGIFNGARRGSTISRKAASKVLGCNRTTLWRWEKETELSEQMEVAQQFAHTTELNNPHIPKHAFEYVAKTEDGYQDRIGWQIANAYTSHYRQHDKKGKVRKMRKAANYAIGEPRDILARGQSHKRRYFDDEKQRIKYIAKHNPDYPCYLFIGEKSRMDKRYNAWDVSVSGHNGTYGDKRVTPRVDAIAKKQRSLDSLPSALSVYVSLFYEVHGVVKQNAIPCIGNTEAQPPPHIEKTEVKQRREAKAHKPRSIKYKPIKNITHDDMMRLIGIEACLSGLLVRGNLSRSQAKALQRRYDVWLRPDGKDYDIDRVNHASKYLDTHCTLPLCPEDTTPYSDIQDNLINADDTPQPRRGDGYYFYGA